MLMCIMTGYPLKFHNFFILFFFLVGHSIISRLTPSSKLVTPLQCTPHDQLTQIIEKTLGQSEIFNGHYKNQLSTFLFQSLFLAN